jgi:hypothetical protein
LFGSFVFWALGVVGFFGLALVVPVYTSCVPRGALRFFIKILLTYQKKNNHNRINVYAGQEKGQDCQDHHADPDICE